MFCWRQDKSCEDASLEKTWAPELAALRCRLTCSGRCSLLHLFTRWSEVQMSCVSCKCLLLSLLWGFDFQPWLCYDLYGLIDFPLTSRGESLEGRAPEQTLVCSPGRGSHSVLTWRETDTGWNGERVRWLNGSVLAPSTFMTRVSDGTIPKVAQTQES